MTKTILITGSTDGIGLATAKSLVKLGHQVLLHGRSQAKLDDTQSLLNEGHQNAAIDAFCADLSELKQVTKLAEEIKAKYAELDVLINNAGIYKTPQPVTRKGFDSRFMVNTIAPYLLTQQLLPLMTNTARVVNLSSAAQAPVLAEELRQTKPQSDSLIYAKSKLAITMWSRYLAEQLGHNGPVVIVVNPASMLGSKMVKDAYGVSGGDIQIGADVLLKAALSPEFAGATGLYFDNDLGAFSQPHADALNAEKCRQIADEIENIIARGAV